MPHDSYYHYFIFLTAFLSSYLPVLECSMWSPGFEDYSQSEAGSNFEGSFDSEEKSEATRLNTGYNYMGSKTDNLFLFNNDFPNSKALIKRKRKYSRMEESFIVDSNKDNKMDNGGFSPVDVAKTIEPENFEITRVTGKDDDKIVMLSNFDGDFKFDYMAGFQSSPSHSLKRSLPPSQSFPPKGFTSRLEPIETKFSPPQSIKSSPLTLTSSSAGLISPIPMKKGISSLWRRNNLKHTNLVELSPDSVTFNPITNINNSSILYDEIKDQDGKNDYEDLDCELAGYFEGFGFYEIDDDGRKAYDTIIQNENRFGGSINK